MITIYRNVDYFNAYLPPTIYLFLIFWKLFLKLFSLHLEKAQEQKLYTPLQTRKTGVIHRPMLLLNHLPKPSLTFLFNRILFSHPESKPLLKDKTQLLCLVTKRMLWQAQTSVNTKADNKLTSLSLLQCLKDWLKQWIFKVVDHKVMLDIPLGPWTLVEELGE